MANKQIRVIKYNKLIRKIDKEFDKVYVNLWETYHPLSLSSKAYTTILVNTKTQNAWIFYLCSKNEFVDVFKIWLPKVENKSKRSMKALYADRRRKFISVKLKNIYNKKGITIKYAAFYMYEKNRVLRKG